MRSVFPATSNNLAARRRNYSTPSVNIARFIPAAKTRYGNKEAVFTQSFQSSNPDDIEVGFVYLATPRT